MYLKSLKLTGFKSFADRTRFEYRPGVTVVVGPNGSGKSNIVDALSWVLGTQSTKTLRTSKMEDVIFAGTATRPALNKAEVTLVIDNEERQIDLDLDEVSITRRLYRDGSSDYELNGVGCRLLDIQDLLSDSGVGRHQHVIIGQGEIGMILNASPEEHRSVIEEAAGILKHRRRKERSERRLDKTDEDLVRLQDLLGELNRQMRPLKRQANAADRYDGLKAEVVALRLYLSGQALERHDRDLTVFTSEKASLVESLEVDQQAVDVLSSELSQLTETASQVGADLSRDTSAAALLETTAERLRRIASVAHERARAVSGRRQAAIERRADLRTEESEILSELASIGQQLETAEAEADAAESEFRRLEDEESALATQNSLSPEGALAAVRGEMSSLEASVIRDEREMTTLKRRVDVLNAQRRDQTTEVDRLNTEIRDLDSELTGLQSSYQSAKKKRESDQSAWSDAEATLSEARLQEASARARVEAIAAALEARFDIEAKSLAERSSGALGSLTSRLDIPAGMEKAVSAALGVWAEAVAFGEGADVRGAVELVKSRGAGSVPVVAASGEEAPPAREIAESFGMDALIDLLGARADQGLAASLLGDVVLVEGWAAGWDLVAKHPALRAVTPEGDLVSSHGVVISSVDSAGTAMLEAAEVDLERATTEVARAESRFTAAKRDFEGSREKERLSLETLEEAELSLAGRSEAMGRIQQSVTVVEQETERLDERLRVLETASEASGGQIDLLRVRLSSLEGEEAERLKVWEEMEGRRLEVAARREIARAEWQDTVASHRGVVERKQLLGERKSRIEAEMSALESGDVPVADADRLKEVEGHAKRAVTVLERRIEELRDRQSRLRDENSGVLSRLESIRSDHEGKRNAVTTARERIAEIDIKLTELRLTREAVVEALRRDADTGVESAMGAPRPDLGSDVNLDELLETKTAQLSRLGPINPLAAEEYRELAERHEFLTEQIADVESSRSELRKVIAALEREIEDRFQAAFAEVSSAYQRYFDVLFPGGRGQIRLIDAEDSQSGVAIDAQPLGKKVSSMSLLSGGERSLAALAFLFAIFEARPSPFYVLDEVEAALDDANLRRFLRIVEEFRKRAQLIIVTHQQQTMEAADVLYGVTMEPGGSSQAIRKEMSVIEANQVA